MPIPKANAYDTRAGRWIGLVPVTWFDVFPHLSREETSAAPKPVARRPIEAAAGAASIIPAARAVSITKKEDGDAEDAR